MITIQPATLRDLTEYMIYGRYEDLEEVYLLTGKTFWNQDVESMQGAQALYHKPSGHLLGLAGVICNKCIWMILTTHIYDHKIEFLRFSKRKLEELLSIYGQLENLTLKKNTLHIEWLKWLGAEFEEDEDMDYPGFVWFTLKRKEGA